MEVPRTLRWGRVRGETKVIVTVRVRGETRVMTAVRVRAKGSG